MKNTIYIVIKYALVIGFISWPLISIGKTPENISPQNHLSKPINEINIASVSINSEKNASEILDENEKKRLIYEVMDSGRKEFLYWLNMQTYVLAGGVILLLGLGVPAIIFLILEKILIGRLNSKIDDLEKARMATIEATQKADIDLVKLKDTIESLRLLENGLEKELTKRRAEIDEVKVLSEQYQANLKDSYDDLKISIDDNSNYFMTANLAKTKWLEAIDSNYESANSVINKLIDDLLDASIDINKKLDIFNELSHFNDKDGRILDALERILEDQEGSATTIEALSLIGQSNHVETAFKILKDLPCDTLDIKTAAILGALGNLQENSEDSNFIRKIVDKIVGHLKSYCDLEPNNEADKKELSNVINAAVSALTYSNEYAEPAIDLLIKLVNDETNSEYKKTAAIVLGDLKDKAKKALPSLERLKESDEPAFILAAEEAITKIRKG